MIKSRVYCFFDTQCSL